MSVRALLSASVFHVLKYGEETKINACLGCAPLSVGISFEHLGLKVSPDGGNNVIELMCHLSEVELGKVVLTCIFSALCGAGSSFSGDASISP